MTKKHYHALIGMGCAQPDCDQMCPTWKAAMMAVPQTIGSLLEAAKLPPDDDSPVYPQYCPGLRNYLYACENPHCLTSKASRIANGEAYFEATGSDAPVTQQPNSEMN